MNPLRRVLVIAEAAWARHHVSLAQEPPGARSGIAGAGEGGRSGSARSEDSERALRLVALGDSMVAACGTSDQSQGLVPDIAAELARLLGRPVTWQAVGRLGATMRRVRYRLLAQLDGHPDVLMLCAGSNDVLAGRGAAEWEDDLDAVLADASGRAGRVVLLSSGQAYRSPSLPRALQREIERRIDRQTEVSRDVAARRGVAFVDLTHEALVDGQDFWASDGFHPSAAGYRIIAAATVGAMPLDARAPHVGRPLDAG